MKRKRFLAIFVTCSILAMVLGAATTYAQPPSAAIISSYVIESEDGSNVTNDPLMAGGTYTVWFEVTVGVVPPDTKLSLSTPLKKVGDRYWNLENEYEGVNTDLWQPGGRTIEFNAVPGTAQFTVEGSIPSDYTWTVLSTEEWAEDDILHFTKPISLVELSLGADVLSTVPRERPAEVKDQAILAYEQTLANKEFSLQQATTDPNAADPKYVKLVEDVMERADDLSDRGYVDDARALLDTLPISVSGFPIPVSEESFLPYLIGIIVLAVILIVSVALLLRARANSSFIRQQVDEEAGRLDVLTVRISKIDKQLGEDVEQVKEQLERIIGR